MPAKGKCSKTAAALAASLLSLAQGASAAVVCNSGSPMPYSVPVTTDGVYVNFVTGAFEPTATPTAGWDFNPFGTISLTFYFGSGGTLGAVSNGTAYQVLAAGTLIGPASTFSNDGSAAATADWRTTRTGQYLGVRLVNESAGNAVNYGWVQLDTTGTQGFPATIRGYCYENTGASIQAGSTTPVSLQSMSVE